jgi:hypothetical protein
MTPLMIPLIWRNPLSPPPELFEVRIGPAQGPIAIEFRSKLIPVISERYNLTNRSDQGSILTRIQK